MGTPVWDKLDLGVVEAPSFHLKWIFQRLFVDNLAFCGRGPELKAANIRSDSKWIVEDRLEFEGVVG